MDLDCQQIVDNAVSRVLALVGPYPLRIVLEVQLAHPALAAMESAMRGHGQAGDVQATAVLAGAWVVAWQTVEQEIRAAGERTS